MTCKKIGTDGTGISFSMRIDGKRMTPDGGARHVAAITVPIRSKLSEEQTSWFAVVALVVVTSGCRLDLLHRAVRCWSEVERLDL